MFQYVIYTPSEYALTCGKISFLFSLIPWKCEVLFGELTLRSLTIVYLSRSTSYTSLIQVGAVNLTLHVNVFACVVLFVLFTCNWCFCHTYMHQLMWLSSLCGPMLTTVSQSYYCPSVICMYNLYEVSSVCGSMLTSGSQWYYLSICMYIQPLCGCLLSVVQCLPVVANAVIQPHVLHWTSTFLEFSRSTSGSTTPSLINISLLLSI